MKKIYPALAFVLASALFVGCTEKTTEQQIQESITKNVHSLTAEERPLAQANAKAFYNKAWPVKQDGIGLTTVNGVWTECRPTDSNKNGMVTCNGLVPQIDGSFKEVTRYCGYRKELVGCSDQDTVVQ
jgi:hypothetical protein